MANSSVYSSLHVQATLNGLSVQGLWDGDDAISIAPGVDRGTLLVGAQGDGLFSIHADRSATISIKLQHTSPTHRLLTQLDIAQQAGQGVIGFPFDLIDTASGEGGSSDRVFIRQAPTVAHGKAAAMREWVLVAPVWVHQVPNELVG